MNKTKKRWEFYDSQCINLTEPIDAQITSQNIISGCVQEDAFKGIGCWNQQTE